MTSVNKKEIEKFSKMAEEWWDPNGKFKPLHKFNPIRIILLKAIRSGEKAPEQPWDGATTLEWTHLPTPAPYHSFETPPDLRN